MCVNITFSINYPETISGRPLSSNLPFSRMIYGNDRKALYFMWWKFSNCWKKRRLDNLLSLFGSSEPCMIFRTASVTGVTERCSDKVVMNNIITSHFNRGMSNALLCLVMSLAIATMMLLHIRWYLERNWSLGRW